MTRFLQLSALLSCVLTLNTALAAQSASVVTVVKAGRLLDPRSGTILSPAAVLIESDRIREVGAPKVVQAHAPGDARLLDLGAATLLPGLVDSHTHLLLDVVVPPEAESRRHYNGTFAPGLLLAITMSPNARVLLGAQLAREDLESGFTTVRNLGHSGIDGDVALRDAINAGRVVGPRILASGRKLAPSAAYLRDLNPALAEAIVRQEFLLLDSPEQAREAVRANLSFDVDLIKISIDDDITQAEANAIVDEAHRQQLKVAVHAISATSIQTAIDAGADSIEHGNNVTDAQLQRMREKGIFLDITPTFWGGSFTRSLEQSIVMSPALKSEEAAANERVRQRSAAMVQRVLKSGVKFAAGSDMCWAYPGQTRGEASALTFRHLHAAGMPALDVIRAATVSAAEMLGWQDRIGSVEAGKYADLIAVAGNPLEDIGELERVRFVMKAGQVIRNDLAPPR